MTALSRYLLPVLLSAPALLAAPRLECAPTAHDFGALATNAVVCHSFTLANTGDALLRIESVRACCGVTACLSTNAIAVGTNATLGLTLAVENQRGQVQKAIYVSTNDPKFPILRLVLSAAIVDRRAR